MLFTSFTFPNGKIAKNRIFKSAMEEQLAQNDQPSEKLIRLYDTWAQGGAGVLVTGNVMVAESGKGSINDVVISDGRSLEMLKNGRKPGTQNDTLLIMQINHAGKQSPAVVNKTPLAPSAVPLVGMDGFINPPRELTADEINGLIQQFVQTAKNCRTGRLFRRTNSRRTRLSHQPISLTAPQPPPRPMGRQFGKPYALPFGNLHRYPRRCGQRFLGGRKTQFGGFPKRRF